MKILGLHHANITVPKAQEAAALEFYSKLLGLVEIEKPASVKGRGGRWLDLGGGQQLHVSVEEGVDRMATRAHIAYSVDDLEAWRGKLKALGIEAQDGIPIPGYVRFEFRDPFGNRVEMLQDI